MKAVVENVTRNGDDVRRWIEVAHRLALGRLVRTPRRRRRKSRAERAEESGRGLWRVLELELEMWNGVGSES
jgi:hypothetical protein